MLGIPTPGNVGWGKGGEPGDPGGGVGNAGKIPGISLNKRLECDRVVWVWGSILWIWDPFL